MVVAHPDDEALFGSDALLADPSIHLYVCSTPERDPERVGHLRAACEHFSVQVTVSPQSDRQENLHLEFGWLPLEMYDEILTHNEKGEYGQRQHLRLHQYIRRYGPPMRCFGYGHPRAEFTLLPSDMAHNRLKWLEFYGEVGRAQVDRHFRGGYEFLRYGCWQAPRKHRPKNSGWRGRLTATRR